MPIQIGIDNAIKGGTGTGTGGGGTPPVFEGLLDTYPGAAAGYSVRRLSSSATNLMRIREGAGDTETDIGYDSNNELDTAAIAAHCGSADGFVVTWYDQSSNANDAEQATSTTQPKIYIGAKSSAVILDNGKPTVRFTSAEQMDTALQINCNPLSAVVVGNVVGTGSGGGSRASFVQVGSLTTDDAYYYYSLEAWNRAAYTLWTGNGSSYQQNASSFTGQMSQMLLTGIFNSTGSNLYADGSASSSNPVSTITTGAVNFLALSHRNPAASNLTQEVIVYPTDQTSNRTGIETEVNAYYNIANLPNPTSGLLFDYPDAASAYSVRQLANTAPLCMRVRRDCLISTVQNDDEATVLFDSSGILSLDSPLTNVDAGVLSTTLGQFVGNGTNPDGLDAVGDGYVVTWFDQSGEQQDATQPTDVKQPQVITAGVIEVENGKPTVQFDGSKYIFLGNYSSLTEGELFTTVRWLGDTSTRGGFKMSTNGFDMHFPYYGGNVYDNFGSTTRYAFTPSITLNQINLYNTLSTSGEWTARLNGNVETTSATNTVGFSSGSIGVSSQTMNHNFSEFILYNAVQSTANRTGIENNINTEFSIYP